MSTLTQFGRACSSAWLCARRPAFLLPGFAAVAIFAVMMVVGIFLSAARPGGSRVTDPPTYLSDLAGAGALSELAGGMVSIIGSCVLAVAAAQMASAFSNGSIRIQLVRQPRRRLWVLGNLAVVAAVAVVLTVVSVLAVVCSAYITAGMYDVPTAGWRTPAAYAELATTTANLAASMVGFALLGAALAVVLRSAIATIGVGLVYALFEQLIGGVLGSAAKFLPAANLSALAVGGDGNIAYPWSIVGSLVVIMLTLVVSTEVLARRDVLD